MANTLKFGAGNWATKEGSTLAYNDENGNFKPLPFDFTRASSATVVNQQGLIETVGSGLPRIDFLGNTKGALLLEMSRTNLIPYSDDFTQSTWQKQSAGVASAPVVTSNYSISPAGTLNADRIIFNIEGGSTSSDFSQITDPVTVSGGDVSNSVYIKSNTTANYTMSLVKPDGNFTTILVTTEWQRFEVNAAAPSASVAFRLRLRGSESTSDFADVSVWGAQLEEGSFASSYIPTSGSATTRSEDNAYQQNVTQVIGQSEGTMFIEFIPKDLSTLQILYQAKSSSGVVGQIDIRLQGGLIRALANDGGVNQFFINGGSYTVGTKYKVALRYKLNDSKLYINGTDSGSDTTCNFTGSSLDQVSFADSLYSFLPSIDLLNARLYNTALTDVELQALTTI